MTYLGLLNAKQDSDVRRRKSLLIEKLQETSSHIIEKRLMNEFTSLEMVDTGDYSATNVDKIKFLIKSRGKREFA